LETHDSQEQLYRPEFVLAAIPERGVTVAGHCPSCREPVSFSSAAATEVCPSCDSRFSTAVARKTRKRRFRRAHARAAAPAPTAAPVRREPARTKPRTGGAKATVIGAVAGGAVWLLILGQPQLIVLVTLLLMLGSVMFNFVQRLFAMR
jgi:hypothetical protein